MKRIFALLCVLTLSVAGRADDWPQWFGPQRDGVWRETGIVDQFPAGGPKLRWRAEVGGAYSGPSVAQGRVILTDRILPTGTDNPDNPFSRDKVVGKERVLCFNDADGKLLWKHEYDCAYEISYPIGPRCSPIIEGDKVYTLGAMGDLYCLSLQNGQPIWHVNLATEYKTEVPLWGYAAHPLLDGDRLITLAGGKDSAVVALNKNTGKEIWRNLSAENPGYCPPVIYNIEGVRQLIIWLPDAAHAINPEDGKAIWSHLNIKKYIKAALTIAMPRLLDNRQLFFTSFYEGPMLLDLHGSKTPTLAIKSKARSEQPDETEGIHSIMPTPFYEDGYLYGVCSYGELRCIKAATFERKWSTYDATVGKSMRWGNAFLTKHENRYFIFNELGDLILAQLSPQGYREISRAHLIDPTNKMARAKTDPRRLVDWAHPAFANRSVYVRSDKELAVFSLAKD